MTPEEEIAELKSLVNDLCTIHIGWRTEDQQQDYLQAQSRIGDKALEIRKKREIARLKFRLSVLEGDA